MARKHLFFILALIIPAVVCLLIQWINADTVIMRDRQELKGVIVEEFDDRVVLSTMEGEKQVMRKDTKDIIYDLEEQNLAAIGDYYQDREMYDKAGNYYKKALEVNPDYKPARDGLNYVTTMIREEENLKNLNYMDRLKEINGWKKNAQKGAFTRQEELEKKVGISLSTVRGSFYVSSVAPLSPAEKAGLERGDKIVAVWGRRVSYARPGEVTNKLLNPIAMDPRVRISRTYTLELKSRDGTCGDLIGAKLGFDKMEGLMVLEVCKFGPAYAAGVQKGDIVTEIEGLPLRYKPLKEVDQMIRSGADNALSIVIERDLVIWKGAVKAK